MSRVQTQRHRSRSTSSRGTAPGARGAPVKCKGCSRMIPSDALSEHTQFFCSLREMPCLCCGYRCSGEAALVVHEKKCKMRRSSGVTLRELEASRSRSEVRVHVSGPLPSRPAPVDAGGDAPIPWSSFPSQCDAEVSPLPSASRRSSSPLVSDDAVTIETVSTIPRGLALAPPPPFLLEHAHDGACAEAGGLALGELLSSSGGAGEVCVHCGHTSQTQAAATRHRKVCGAAPVLCPLQCGLRLPRGLVPQHIRETARSHQPLCLPNESDYGADDPRAVTALLLNALLVEVRGKQGKECAPTESEFTIPGENLSTTTDSTPSSGMRDGAFFTPMSRGASPAASLPPPTRLFNPRGSLGGGGGGGGGGSSTGSPMRHVTAASPAQAPRSPLRAAPKPVRDVGGAARKAE